MLHGDGGAVRAVVVPEGIARWQCAMLRQAEDALQRADGRRIDNLEAIIASASLSPEAVCTAFGSRHAFLIALSKKEMAPMLEPLTRSESAEAFRDKLLAFGRRATEHYASGYMRNLRRVALTECIRNAEIGCDLYTAGPGWLEEELAQFIEAAKVSGFVEPPEDSHYLAGALIALLTARLENSDASARELVADEAIAEIVSHFQGGIQGLNGNGRVA